ncbi:MAG: hypothetical protein ACOCY6_03465 [Halodesulfurarchaeum sp.]
MVDRLIDEAIRGRNGRGQIGASTIIILIAALLIAGVTAGVLFNVTGALQSQADLSGESVESDVENPVEVPAIIGGVNADETGVDRVRIVLRLSDTADSVDLSRSTVSLETPTDLATLVYDSDQPSEGETFAVEVLADPDGSAPRLSESADRFVVVIDTSTVSEYERITAEIRLQRGATKEVTGRVPEDLAGRTNVTLR